MMRNRSGGGGGEGRGGWEDGRMGGVLLLTAVAWIPFPESGNSETRGL